MVNWKLSLIQNKIQLVPTSTQNQCQSLSSLRSVEMKTSMLEVVKLLSDMNMILELMSQRNSRSMKFSESAAKDVVSEITVS
jgi:hypothetical protein